MAIFKKIALALLKLLAFLFLIIGLLLLVGTGFAIYEANYPVAAKNVGLSILFLGMFFLVRKGIQLWSAEPIIVMGTFQWVFILFFISLVTWLKTSWFPSDLTLLTREREKVFPEVRQAFLKYYSEQKKFPVQIKNIQPQYINPFPNVLDNSNYPHRGYQIRYYASKDQQQAQAFISYFRCLAPDCRASFNLLTGETWYDH